MDFISLTGIAVGLAMDAFAVSVTNGAVTKKVNLAFALRMSVCFGVFQAFMPFIGWLIGTAGAGFISSIDHWIALILLAIIGGQMLRESFAHRKLENALCHGGGHQHRRPGHRHHPSRRCGG